MNRAFYSSLIENFLKSSPDEVLGKLVSNNPFSLEQMQRNAWVEEIKILQQTLKKYKGSIYFEYTIPRMGQRADVLLLIESVLFVLEFKVGEKEFTSYAIDQVWDYALDLKNFHETSHDVNICPILIATKAPSYTFYISTTPQNDKLMLPVKCNADQLNDVIDRILSSSNDKSIDPQLWERGKYCPTPTIVEAAKALYNGHSVHDISRSDASAINLSRTSEAIASIIRFSKERSQKAICFVTGVPGSGKTLVGLNIATAHIEQNSDLYSVFLSGNGPLVSILREALTRDKVEKSKKEGVKVTKGGVMSEVKMFIQNVHHFRDDCLVDIDSPPIEHVALFDEAQRAWTREQTSMFMRTKKKVNDFDQSEPEFLISCLNRHDDWAVIVCLVGGGQEINTGEAGISEWINSLYRGFGDWHVYISPHLTDSEYTAKQSIEKLMTRPKVTFKNNLHLSVSMRSFRAEDVSLLVKQILDIDIKGSQETLSKIKDRFPIAITRSVGNAKKWLKHHARGSERYGIVVSSQAERLKPYAIDVKSPINPIHWFLDGKEDVRSSYYLESVATEFHIQGLELDWVCVTWDADFRYSNNGWKHRSFRGSRWTQIRKETRKMYLKNAYRVLLTRARQGMIIVVPLGDAEDPTRASKYYDPTFEYLRTIGFDVIS
jgi:hypothetical protein